MDTAPARNVKKLNFYDDAISEDFSRAPTSVLKNRASHSQKPAAHSSLLAKAGNM